MTRRVAAEPAVEPAAPAGVLTIETPFGRPVRWAETAMVSDIGDSHELNDDRCLVLTSSELGQRAAGSTDFLLCLLADGATGSTFRARAGGRRPLAWPRQAGWRASQLAQGAFVEDFLSSAEVDVLDRLKDGLRSADRALTDSTEGKLSTTLVALYLAADGTAYAASIGDSTLLVLPPRRTTAGDRRLKKLGYEDSTSVGSGDTTLSTVDASECIEQWWPHKEDGGASIRVTPGTYLVLMSDGISDNLPAEQIDQMLHRHPLDRATLGLPQLTRDRRSETHKRSGASTQQLGLDNMSAIVARFDGQRRVGPVASSDRARLVTVMGSHGGPAPDAGGQFGMACVAEPDAPVVGACVRKFIESEHHGDVRERLAGAFSDWQGGAQPAFAMLAVDATGTRHRLSLGGKSIGAGSSDVPISILERSVSAARETRAQRLARTPRVWGPAVAVLAIFVLVSSAFATGAVRPAPPPVPTPRPGEPRRPADSRPSLLIGGFVLQPPLQPRAVTAADGPAAGGEPDASEPPVEGAQQPAVSDSAPVQAAPNDQAVQAAPRCTNLFGIGCPAPPAPTRSDRLPPAPPVGVVPVPSPAAVPEESLDGLQAATSAPPHGSRLESALQGVSMADQNFAREVDPLGR